MLSQFWNIKPAVSTEDFIRYARDKENNIWRLPEIKFLSMNDALLIRTPDLNHIALFRETRTYSPSNDSETMLVVESSSSCGGACWTFYDESFFHGWALIRTAPKQPEFKMWKKDYANLTKMLTDADEWGEVFHLPK
ncbi:MAG: hypothetical protein NTV56_05505 [Alphaproteobacteria bacterium]|nr:hypothetical protein [Alphaproteobacteria bacterium]